MKKKFECGHIGKGKFCHRCSDQERMQALEKVVLHERARNRTAKKEANAMDAIDLSALTHIPSLLVKARTIISAIASGETYNRFGGKLLVSTGKEFVSIKIGYKFRLVYRAKPLVPHELLSHEDYNNRYVN